MTKIVEYDYLEDVDIDLLVNEVNRLIEEEGWQPLGGMVAIPIPPTFRYLQTVVKYEQV